MLIKAKIQYELMKFIDLVYNRVFLNLSQTWLNLVSQNWYFSIISWNFLNSHLFGENGLGQWDVENLGIASKVGDWMNWLQETSFTLIFPIQSDLVFKTGN